MQVQARSGADGHRSTLTQVSTIPTRAASPAQLKPIRSRQQSSEATRRRLLDAGRVSFGRNGYSKTAVQELLAEAAVTPPVLYYHFGNKLGLFTAVAEEVYGQFLGELHASIEGIEEFHETVDALLESAGAAHLRSPTIAAVAFTAQVEARRDPELARALQPTLHSFRNLLEEVVARAPDDLVQSVGRDGLLRGIGSIINGLLSLAVTLGRVDDIVPAIEAIRHLIRPNR